MSAAPFLGQSGISTIPRATLLSRVRALVARGNEAEAELLVLLGELDARRLYVEEGCASMFVYCQRVLHFAEGVAYKRIRAARAARRHPKILTALRRGELHLTAVSLISPHVTESNCADLIRAATHRSTDAVRQVVADLAPKPGTSRSKLFSR